MPRTIRINCTSRGRQLNKIGARGELCRRTNVLVPGEVTPGRNIDGGRWIGSDDPHRRPGGLATHSPINQHEQLTASEVATIDHQSRPAHGLLHASDLSAGIISLPCWGCDESLTDRADHVAAPRRRRTRREAVSRANIKINTARTSVASSE